MKDVTRLRTEDGSHTLHSNHFDVAYHSLYGAVEESIHVFLAAGLQAKILEGKKDISILEIGFGTGLNAFLTYLDLNSYPGIKIHYTGVEAFPISLEEAESMNYPEFLNRQEYTSDFIAMHTLESEQSIDFTNGMRFTKMITTFESLQFDNQFDIIYFDAFAPTTQPTLWEEPLLKSMYDALKHNGIFVTYCAKGVFKRALKAVGFTIEALPGPAKKRQMTRAWKR